MTLAELTTFFGWATVLNYAVLLVTGLGLMVGRDWAAGLHARMFGLDEADVRLTFYRWLAAYKVLVFVFAFVPWLALQMM